MKYRPNIFIYFLYFIYLTFSVCPLSLSLSFLTQTIGQRHDGLLVYIIGVWNTRQSVVPLLTSMPACISLSADEKPIWTVWIIIFYMFNPIIWHSFLLIVSDGSLYWFHRHSRSLEILYGFSSCPSKWSIVISPRKALPGEGMENSHHFTISLYTWLLFCKPRYLVAVLWIQTLFYGAQGTCIGLSLAALESWGRGFR